VPTRVVPAPAGSVKFSVADVAPYVTDADAVAEYVWRAPATIRVTLSVPDAVQMRPLTLLRFTTTVTTLGEAPLCAIDVIVVDDRREEV